MATTSPASRPDRALAARKRQRYVSTGEASKMLDGILAAGVIRRLALAGRVPGAIAAGDRVLIPRRSVDGLVRELEYQAPSPTVLHPRAGHTTLDGPMAV